MNIISLLYIFQNVKQNIYTFYLYFNCFHMFHLIKFTQNIFFDRFKILKFDILIYTNNILK